MQLVICWGPFDTRYSCAYSDGQYTGTQCTATSNPDAIGDVSEDTPPPAKPERTTEKEDCRYITDDNGVQHCVSKHTNTTPGFKQCEGENCTKEDAKKTESKTETKVTTKDNPDGTKTVTKTDTHTKTDCVKNSSNCKTTTTTTTKTTTVGADGSVLDTKVTCTGPQCGKSPADDADGDGMEDCGNDCADVKSGGKGGPDGAEDGFGDVMGYGDALGSFMGRVKNSPLGQAVSGIAVPGGGSCSMPSRSIPIIGSVSAQGMCDLAHVLDGLRFVFLALFGFAAVRVVMSA